MLERVVGLGGHMAVRLDATTFQKVRPVLDWHPSEASGLLALASEGVRGLVEMRDAGSQVPLDEKTSAVFALDARKAAAGGPASALQRTNSLALAESLTRQLTGTSEIDYERRKAGRLHRAEYGLPRPADLARVDGFVREAAERGADFLTARRLAELLGFGEWRQLTELRHLLASERAAAYRPPVLATSSP